MADHGWFLKFHGAVPWEWTIALIAITVCNSLLSLPTPSVKWTAFDEQEVLPADAPGKDQASLHQASDDAWDLNGPTDRKVFAVCDL